MPPIDLFTLIFEEILKISPQLMYKYQTIPEQLLHLIFLPHVILFLFLFGFGWMLAAEHRGFRYLLALAGYLFVITQGWYGTFLIPLLETWFTIMLIFGLFLFFGSKILHPITARKIGREVAGVAGKAVGKRLARQKEIDRLEDKLKFVKKRIRDLEGRRRGNPAIEYQYEEYQKKKNELKRKIDDLGG